MPHYTADVYFKLHIKEEVFGVVALSIVQDGQHEILVHAPSLEHAKAAILDEYNKYAFKNKRPDFLGLTCVQISEHPNPAGPDIYPWTKVITVESSR